MSRTDPPHTRTSPQDVRGKNFTVRLRGLAPDEVRYFLAGLTDQLDAIQAQVATLAQENETLTQEPAATFRALGRLRRNGPPTRP